MSFHSLVAHFFLVLNNIPLPGCAIVYLSIRPLKDTLVVSKFKQWWIRLFQTVITSVCKFLWAKSFHLFWINTKEYDCWILWVCVPLWNTGKPSSKMIALFFNSYQKCVWVPVTPHPCQYLVVSVFQIVVILIGVVIPSLHFTLVAQCCLTFCDPMNCSTPGLPVHHRLPEFTQTHVHRVGDAIQPSHPLSSPSPPAPSPSQHQGLFQWVNTSHEVAKVLEFQLQHQSFQWTPRTDLL